MTRRKVQLWRFFDANDKPVPPIPAGELHRFLVAQDDSNADMAYLGTDDYVTHLSPIGGVEAQVVLSRIRADDLPSQRVDGKVVALDPNVGELAEGSHFLFLPRNLVAFIGTGFSPRPGRLAEWMRNRLGWDVWLEPVVRQDVGPILDNLRKITSVEVKIAADEAKRLELADFFEGENDPLGALLTAQRAQQGGIITVGWSVGQGSDANQGWFQRLVDRLRRADLERFRSAKAKVYVEHSDNAVPVDFLQDRIVAEVEIDHPTGRQRLLESPVALAAMQRAWEQFKDTDKVLDTLDPLEGTPLQVPAALIDNPKP